MEKKGEVRAEKERWIERGRGIERRPRHGLKKKKKKIQKKNEE